MQLIISVKFPFGRFRGKTHNRPLRNSFPPSPSRLFQALIAASHRGVYVWQNAEIRDRALEWLEKLESAPIIDCCEHFMSEQKLIHYLPSNNSFKISSSGKVEHDNTNKSLDSWVIKGNGTLRYIWQFPNTEENRRNAEVVCNMARLVTHLGHGQDVVFARGEVLEDDNAELKSADERRRVFYPKERAGSNWTVPNAGALAVYRERYEKFLETGNAHSISLLNVTRQVDYVPRDAIDLTCPYALFEIRRLEDEDRFYSFDGRKLREPAAMVRQAAVEIFYPSEQDERNIKKAARFKKTYDEDLILRKILGYEPNAEGEKKAVNAPHLAFLPLPHLFPPHPSGRIHRIVLAGFGFDGETERALFDDVAKNLNGAEIKDNGELVVRLIRVEEYEENWKFFEQFYGQASRLWRSVMPIILSGFSRRGRKPEQLLYRALNQIGIANDAVESVAIYRSPIVPKTFRPMDYHLNGYLNENPRYHAEIIFKRPVSGCLVIGRGRHVGFGLMMPITKYEHDETL